MSKDKAPRSLPRVFMSELIGNGARRRAVAKGEAKGNHPIQNALAGLSAQGLNTVFPTIVRAVNMDNNPRYHSTPQAKDERDFFAMATFVPKTVLPFLIPEYLPHVPPSAGVAIFATVLAVEHLIVAGMRTKETRRMERRTGRRWPQ